MPSGAKKRKAAKKKKANGSSTPNSHQGENDAGELSSPTSQYPSVEVEKSSSENKSKDVNEIEVVSKSKSSNSSSSNDSSDDDTRVIEKNVVVLEPAPEKAVDSLLEQVSQVFDGIKNDNKKELVVKSVKENEVEKVISLDEKDSLVSKDYVSSSTPPENLISSEVNGANESDTVGHSDRQAPTASTAVTVQRTTTWKSCCGLFEVFSG